jgi:L-arabinonolactonase
VALDTLYITSARDGLSAESLRAEPLAGALFAVAVGMRGIAESRFAGTPTPSTVHAVMPLD